MSGRGCACLADAWHMHCGSCGLCRLMRSLRTSPVEESTSARRKGRWVELGLEVGGCWDSEASAFLSLLALRLAAQVSWVLRWSGITAVAARRAFAATFLGLPLLTERVLPGHPQLCTSSLRMRACSVCRSPVASPPARSGSTR